MRDWADTLFSVMVISGFTLIFTLAAVDVINWFMNNMQGGSITLSLTILGIILFVVGVLGGILTTRT